tara:strand:- start:438 stop:1076 length:639 start_codon:yes stop_codon:yes gene_type:complete
MILEPIVPVNDYVDFFFPAGEAILTSDKTNFVIKYLSTEVENRCKLKKGWPYIETLITPKDDMECIGKNGGSADDLGVWKRWDYLEQANKITPGDHDGRMNSIIHNYLLKGYRVRFWAGKDPIEPIEQIVSTPDGPQTMKEVGYSQLEKYWKKVFRKHGVEITGDKKYNLPWNDRNVKILLENKGLKSAKFWKRELNESNNIIWVTKKKSQS